MTLSVTRQVADLSSEGSSGVPLLVTAVIVAVAVVPGGVIPGVTVPFESTFAMLSSLDDQLTKLGLMNVASLGVYVVDRVDEGPLTYKSSVGVIEKPIMGTRSRMRTLACPP